MLKLVSEQKFWKYFFKYFGASREWAYQCDCLLCDWVECWKGV